MDAGTVREAGVGDPRAPVHIYDFEFSGFSALLIASEEGHLGVVREQAAYGGCVDFRLLRLHPSASLHTRRGAWPHPRGQMRAI